MRQPTVRTRTAPVAAAKPVGAAAQRAELVPEKEGIEQPGVRLAGRRGPTRSPEVSDGAPRARPRHSVHQTRIMAEKCEEGLDESKIRRCGRGCWHGGRERSPSPSAGWEASKRRPVRALKMWRSKRMLGRLSGRKPQPKVSATTTDHSTARSTPTCAAATVAPPLLRGRAAPANARTCPRRDAWALRSIEAMICRCRRKFRYIAIFGATKLFITVAASAERDRSSTALRPILTRSVKRARSTGSAQ